MKKITTSKGTFIFVEVPDDAREFGFRSGHFSYQLPDMEFEAKLMPEVRLKNKGKLTFICTTSNATEEQAVMVVDKYASFYTSYTEKNLLYKKAKTALRSLIKSIRLDHTNNYAILKII